MTDIFQDPDGATPLEPDEQHGLKQAWITARRDLNEAEQENIVQGAAWARGRRQRKAEILSDVFAKRLHERMFGDVWDWAGAYRLTERNIGIEAHRIANDMIMMFDDVRYWVGHLTYPPDELAIRFHHRLVSIHPFPNGNGRHARLMADLLIERLGRQSFTWGGGTLQDVGVLRATYIAALKAADDHEISSLVIFARS